MYTPSAGKLRRVAQFWQELGNLERQGHGSRFRLASEAAYLGVRYRIGPAYYLLAGLSRKELSWEEKVAFMSESDCFKYAEAINPPRYQHVMLNKLIVNAVFNMFNIPTPPFYGVVDEENGETWDRVPLRTPDDMVRLLTRLEIQEVCFKLIEGLRGYGFYKVRIDCSSKLVTLLPDGEKLSLEDFWVRLHSHAMGRYFVQGVVDQHPDVARYNPWSVNTVRGLVVKTDDGTWYMHGAALRMGVGKTSVDNMSAGGLGSPVDVETGRLKPAAEERFDRPIHSQHPATGVRFAGEVLPFWPDVIEICNRIGTLFPYVEMFSCDIAFGVDGPLVLELGATFDEPQLYFDMGLRPLMEKLLKRRRSQ